MGNIMSTDRNAIGAPGGTAEGIYLFCFARPHCLPDSGIAGLDDQQAVSQWAFKDIVAVLGMSSIDDFCGPEAEDRMTRLGMDRASCLSPRGGRGGNHAPFSGISRPVRNHFFLV